MPSKRVGWLWSCAGELLQSSSITDCFRFNSHSTCIISKWSSQSMRCGARLAARCVDFYVKLRNLHPRKQTSLRHPSALTMPQHQASPECWDFEFGWRQYPRRRKCFLFTCLTVARISVSVLNWPESEADHYLFVLSLKCLELYVDNPYTLQWIGAYTEF
jgi:hypothetical protein